MNVTVLVDFDNDSVGTALEVADALGDRLWGVRLDTSDTLVDRSLWDEMGDFKPTGVNERLVEQGPRGARRRGPRRASGSSSPAASPPTASASSRRTASRSTPTASARRSSAGENDFTADVVQVDGRPVAKVGRS